MKRIKKGDLLEALAEVMVEDEDVMELIMEVPQMIFVLGSIVGKIEKVILKEGEKC